MFKIYHLDPIKLEVKLALLTDIDMILIVEKGNRGRTFHTMYRYANVNKKNMKDYQKNIEL